MRNTESYLIGPQGYEAVYGNMPVFGLAKATTHLPAVGLRSFGFCFAWPMALTRR